MSQSIKDYVVPRVRVLFGPSPDSPPEAVWGQVGASDLRTEGEPRRGVLLRGACGREG